MTKRYDYHSYVSQIKLLLIVWPGLLLIYWSIFHKSGMPPLSDFILICLFFGIGIGVSIIAYMNIKSTLIEISDDGILYNTWRRKIFASWVNVREIRLRGRINKIYTEYGNFTFGYLEPAFSPPVGFVGILKNEGKYLDELTDEIKRRASRAKVTYGLFMRPPK